MGVSECTRNKRNHDIWSWLRGLLCASSAAILAVTALDTAKANDFDWSQFEKLQNGDLSARNRKRATRRRSVRGPSKYRKRRATRRSRKKSKTVWKPYKSLKGPVQVVISLQDQNATIFKGGQPIASTRISTGKPGYSTPKGIFSVVQKKRRHYSNLYGGAPMPHMQRLTWSGIALHGGYVPNYAASHGCIRLPYSFAKQLFSVTKRGAQVVIGREKAIPSEIVHANLFQPSPPKAAAVVTAGVTIDPLRENLTIRSDGGMVQEPVVPTISIPNSVQETSSVTLTAGRQTAAKVSLRRSKFTDGYDSEDIIYERVSEAAKEPRDQPATDKTEPSVLRNKKPETGKNSAQIFKKRSKSPLRILVTRRVGQERLKDVQRLLINLNYELGEVDGAIGRKTRAAIKSFQKDNDLPLSGKVTDALIVELYRAAGKTEIKAGHIYVRQDYKQIFDMPLDIRDPSKPLGTHVFTAMYFENDAAEVRWTTQTVREQLDGSNKSRRKKQLVEPNPIVASTASDALDRLEIPEDVRKRISAMLTPGSSLIVTDNGVSRETGKGTDFIVLTR